MPAPLVVEDLPDFVRRIAYDAERDLILLTLHEYNVSLEMTTAEVDAFINALSLCRARAAQAAKVIDVDADEEPSGPQEGPDLGPPDWFR